MQYVDNVLQAERVKHKAELEKAVLDSWAKGFAEATLHFLGEKKCKRLLQDMQELLGPEGTSHD